MEKIGEILKNNPWIIKIIYSLIVLTVSIVIYLLFSNLFFTKLEKKNYKIFKNNKSNTYLKLLRSIIRYIFIIIIFFIILKINGVNITAMIAGVGVFGIVFGFAIQDALKDIIKGIDIITDSYYQVGDIIRVNKYTGKVLSIGIKTTKIEDVFEKNIVSISNRNIEEVEIISHMINIDVPLPYELKIKEAEKTIYEMIKEIEKIKNVESAEYRGVNKLDESCILYQVKVYSDPTSKVQTRRDALTCIIKYLEEKNIHVPYKQIDIHQK